jgi:enterochelin esterase-like enzyme
MLRGNQIYDILSMEAEQIEEVMVEMIELQSELLERTVRIDFYQSVTSEKANDFSLLLMNDGQDLLKMDFEHMLQSFYSQKLIRPLLVAGIHCGEDRKNEYGVSAGPDYLGRGAKAALYEQFIITELLPFIRSRFDHLHISETSFAGFSLGALSALDITWNNPDIFTKTGIFSASLWWRSVDKSDKNYDPSVHRMMHNQVRQGSFHPGKKFFFECGEQDEWEDRNKNGVIDSIDDTIDLMRELIKKGYLEGRDIYYLQLSDGKHDVQSWAKAIPDFLIWGWGLHS